MALRSVICLQPKLRERVQIESVKGGYRGRGQCDDLSERRRARERLVLHPLGLDVGKGQGAVQEDVQIVCAESSQRYMSREEAMQEAKARIKVKIEKECGTLPERQFHCVVNRSK